MAGEQRWVLLEDANKRRLVTCQLAHERTLLRPRFFRLNDLTHAVSHIGKVEARFSSGCMVKKKLLCNWQGAI